MNKKKFIIDGSRFNDIEGFYTEIDRILTRDLSWETGHNLNAFNDLLYGGFGVHEYGEPITLIWKNSDKSKKDLGYKATVEYYENILTRCHPTNINRVNELLENAKREMGDTLFDIIIQIIIGHQDIELIITKSNYSKTLQN